MWRVLSRGIRETLERRIGFSRKDKASGEDHPLNSVQYKLLPGIASNHKFDGCCNGCKNGSCRDKKERRQDQQEARWQNDSYMPQPRLLGALGWSGVLVLGWYLCQPAYHRQRTPSSRRTEYLSLLGVLSRVAQAQPLCVLPQTNEPAVTAAPFGPPTAEQALDEAADELARAHGGAENRLGVACLQQGRQPEALAHFQAAALMGCACGAYNLGLCHELGVGTVRDLRQAAHYYEQAARGGHATAMYNLGVFCVRGWGGLPVDCMRARQLFEAAAQLGQTDARQALTMVSSVNPMRGGLLTQILGGLKMKQPAGKVPSELDDLGLDAFGQTDFSVVC